jgi:hypothetical protein
MNPWREPDRQVVPRADHCALRVAPFVLHGVEVVVDGAAIDLQVLFAELRAVLHPEITNRERDLGRTVRLAPAVLHDALFGHDVGQAVEVHVRDRRQKSNAKRSPDEGSREAGTLLIEQDGDAVGRVVRNGHVCPAVAIEILGGHAARAGRRRVIRASGRD